MRKLLLAILLCGTVAMAGGKSVYDFTMNSIDGEATSLSKFQGKVLLLVNVASRCGFTPQYAALEKVYEKYKDRGFVIVGVPANNFGGQEPGSNQEIKTFCSAKYNVTFPLFDKLHVKGPEQHPLYTALSGKESPFPGDVKWNFGKFLIGRDGKIVKRFDSAAKPDSPQVTQAIESALAAKAQ